jgi:hypothetical protein
VAKTLYVSKHARPDASTAIAFLTTRVRAPDIDNMMPIVVWSQYFLVAQGYEVTQNLLLQDNQSSILLERNGKASSGHGTLTFNISSSPTGLT